MYFFMVIKASGIVVGRVRKRRRPCTETVRPPLETLVNVKGQMNLKLLIKIINYVILVLKAIKRKDHLFLSNFDRVIYQINHFPADKYKGNQINYLLVRDYSSGLAFAKLHLRCFITPKSHQILTYLIPWYLMDSFQVCISVLAI